MCGGERGQGAAAGEREVPLYAVVCWTSDGGSLGDAQERSQQARRTSGVRPLVSTIVCDYYLSDKRLKLTTVCFVTTKTTHGGLEEATGSLDSLKVNSLVDL